MAWPEAAFCWPSSRNVFNCSIALANTNEIHEISRVCHAADKKGIINARADVTSNYQISWSLAMDKWTCLKTYTQIERKNREIGLPIETHIMPLERPIFKNRRL